MSIVKNSEPGGFDLDSTRMADLPPKPANLNLILGVVTLVGISAGFWVVVTLTISHWLR